MDPAQAADAFVAAMIQADAVREAASIQAGGVRAAAEIQAGGSVKAAFIALGAGAGVAVAGLCALASGWLQSAPQRRTLSAKTKILQMKLLSAADSFAHGPLIRELDRAQALAERAKDGFQTKNHPYARRCRPSFQWS